MKSAKWAGLVGCPRPLGFDMNGGTSRPGFVCKTRERFWWLLGLPDGFWWSL